MCPVNPVTSPNIFCSYTQSHDNIILTVVVEVALLTGVRNECMSSIAIATVQLRALMHAISNRFLSPVRRLLTLWFSHTCPLSKVYQFQLISLPPHYVFMLKVAIFVYTYYHPKGNIYSCVLCISYLTCDLFWPYTAITRYMLLLRKLFSLYVMLYFACEYVVNF
jgi:hypothetical protein